MAREKSLTLGDKPGALAGPTTAGRQQEAQSSSADDEADVVPDDRTSSTGDDNERQRELATASESSRDDQCGLSGNQSTGRLAGNEQEDAEVADLCWDTEKHPFVSRRDDRSGDGRSRAPSDHGAVAERPGGDRVARELDEGRAELQIAGTHGCSHREHF